MNRVLMVVFGMAGLLLLEFFAGNLGLYFPYSGLGLFYFTVSARRRWYWFLPLAIFLGLTADAIYSRPEYGSVVVNIVAVFLGHRYRSIRGTGALALFSGMIIAGGATFLRYSTVFLHRGTWAGNWQSVLAYSLFSALLGAITMLVIIVCFDYFAKVLGMRHRFDKGNRTEMDYFNATRPDDED